jgi:hypothetical protein
MGQTADWSPLLNNLVSAGGGGLIVGLLAWLKEREKSKQTRQEKIAAVPTQMVEAAADFQKFLNEHSERFVAELRSDVAGLKSEIQVLKEENVICRGESNQLRQHIESLEELLRRQGLAVPRRKVSRMKFTEDRGTTIVTRNGDEDV